MDRFTIDIPAAEIDDLHRRIDASRWPAQVPTGWSEGTEPGYLHSLLSYWRDGFDWRRIETELNSFEQYLVPVSGGRVHTVHMRGTGPDPLPIVISHGWPSTFAEWRHVITALADPASNGGDPADAFDVITPSLPGYAFSDPPSSPGVKPREIARRWAELMAAFGYERFGAVGCDWGAYVTALLALDHPDRVVGAHMGMLSLSGPRREGADDETRAHTSRVKRWREEEHGYVAIQSTKPATLAYGLNDSPAGLAAWIAEKWRAWSDCAGDPEAAIGRDELLTAISLYWHTGSIGTASRLYRESRLAPIRLGEGEKIRVPCGFLLESPGCPGDARTFLDVPRIGAPPISRAEQICDVHRWTVADHGGHFPALETPDLFVEEVRAFFRPLRAR